MDEPSAPLHPSPGPEPPHAPDPAASGVPKRSLPAILVILAVLLPVTFGAAVYFGYTAYSMPRTSETGAVTGSPAVPAKAPAGRTAAPVGTVLPFSVPDTGQHQCYTDTTAITCPQTGQAYHGQDAQYQTAGPSFTDNGDGTVTDTVTGLTWTKAFKRLSRTAAYADVGTDRTGGYSDWRIPTIKELYSLIDFSGNTGSGGRDTTTPPSDAVPFLDTVYFNFEYGKTGRYIDAQYMSATDYVSTTMNGNATVFGVNFADGRIKGYPQTGNREDGKFYVRYVRGTTVYGNNDLTDNGDGTVTDRATGLMWMQRDSGKGMIWKNALAYCENLSFAGRSDWRLPDAKELQSILDYTRAPDTTHSPAVDPVFITSSIRNENNQTDYPYFWTSTTHLEGQAGRAVYIAFGRAMGYMNGRWMDVHGAGAQRSDPKTGDPSAYPTGHGPQGDAIRIYDYVRCVRGGSVTSSNGEAPSVGSAAVGRPSPPPQSAPATEKQPPQEAVTACGGKTAGTACTFQTPQGTVSGTCRDVAGTVACIPQ